MTSDKFQLQYTFKKKITLFSNYSNSQINFLTSLNSFNEVDIQNLYSLDIGIMKEIDLKKNWSSKIVFNPQVRNNSFKNIDSDSYIFNSSILFFKKINTNSDINFGLEYGTLLGSPSIYPVFQYNKSINKKYSFGIGFPKSFLKYSVNEKNKVLFNANYNSYFTKINDATSRVVNQEILKYNSVFLSKLDTSLEYNYIFYNESVVSIRLGKSFGNKLKIEENNNEVSNFNFTNDFIISMGFKYNLNFK
jgi:hypothetical protein